MYKEQKNSHHEWLTVHQSPGTGWTPAGSFPCLVPLTPIEGDQVRQSRNFIDQGMGREKDPFHEGDGGGKLLRGGYAIRIAEGGGDLQK